MAKAKFNGVQVRTMKKIVRQMGLYASIDVLEKDHGISVSVSTLSKYVKTGPHPVMLRAGRPKVKKVA